MKKIITAMIAAGFIAAPALAASVTVSFASDDGTTQEWTFDQETSMLNIVDLFIPWFDTIVGALLILGLFTRLASLAGAAFLASVIASQPPWIQGVDPNYYVLIELFAMLVIFATCAGRMGGLDFFFSNQNTPETQTER